MRKVRDIPDFSRKGVRYSSYITNLFSVHLEFLNLLYYIWAKGGGVFDGQQSKDHAVRLLFS
jgi:hypothetical protein